MKRRTFLEVVGASAAGAAFLPRVAGASPRKAFRAWTWVHGNNTDTLSQWRERFARFRAGGISGVVVGGGATVLRRSSLP